MICLPPLLSVAYKPSTGPGGNRPDGWGAASRRELSSRHCRDLGRGLLPPGCWQFGAEPSGRPLVVDGEGAPGPDVSFSHSGDWAAAAISFHGRVGIDLEVPRPGRRYLAIAEAYLSEAERRAVAAEGEAALLAFWTMREAVAKLGGGGLAEALSLDGTGLAEGRNGTCRSDSWVLAHRDFGPIHMAVAWAGGNSVPAAGDLLLEGLGTAFGNARLP